MECSQLDIDQKQQSLQSQIKVWDSCLNKCFAEADCWSQILNRYQISVWASHFRVHCTVKNNCYHDVGKLSIHFNSLLNSL